MEWKLVRLATKVWLVEKAKAEGMAKVAGQLGSPKKQGRYTNLLSIDGKNWFLDAELLGTLEEMTLGAVPLGGAQVAKFLALATQEQDKLAEQLRASSANPCRFIDVALTLSLVTLAGCLLLR